MLVRAFSLTFDLFRLPFLIWLLPCQILPEETPMQEQEPDSPLKDPASVECDLVDSPAQHATDGKAVKPPLYSPAIVMN